MNHKFVRTLLVVGLVVGCASITPPPTQEDVAGLPIRVHWVRNSAEYVALTTQIYNSAGLRLETMHSEGVLPASWAVALDIDETILSTSGYQKERTTLGLSYSPDSWRMWVARKEATLIPGAKVFLQKVERMGGTIALVTNRSAPECADTEDNLHAHGVSFDIILCRTDTKNKQLRWDSVEDGSATGASGTTEIVMWFGDNIHDFPGLNQELCFAGADATGDFGERFFVLPNPLYGSWMDNPKN